MTLLLIMLGMVTLFLLQRVPIELTALTGLTILTLLGFLSPEQAFSGFSSPVTVTIFSMFALGAALASTGVTDRLAEIVYKIAKQHEGGNVALVMILGCFFSSFMNNVAAAALLLPAVASISMRTQIPQSRLLIPLSFATVLGGMCTVIGTTPNLMAAEVLRSHGLKSFDLVTFLPFGISASVAGIIYMVVWGRKALPFGAVRRRTPSEDELPRLYGIDQRLYTAIVSEDKDGAGKSLSNLGFGHDFGLIVVSINRLGKQILAPAGKEVLQIGDMLTISGQANNVQKIVDLMTVLDEQSPVDPQLTSDSIAVFEAVLSPRSQLIGKTLLEVSFRERYDCLVLEILRGSTPLRHDISSIPLEFGDGLLLQGPRSRLAMFRGDPDFLILDDLGFTAHRGKKAPFVFLAFLVFFLLALVCDQSIHISAFVAALIVLVSGALSTEDFYRSMSWRVIFFIAAIMPLQIIAQTSGFPDWLSHHLVSSFGHPSVALLLAFFLFCGSAASQLIDPSLAIVFLGPVSIELSQMLGQDPRPMLMALTLGASIGFQSPYAQRANLLVMAVGGYRTKDYLRIGTPMALIVALTVFVLLLGYVFLVGY